MCWKSSKWAKGMLATDVAERTAFTHYLAGAAFLWAHNMQRLRTMQLLRFVHASFDESVFVELCLFILGFFLKLLECSWSNVGSDKNDGVFSILTLRPYSVAPSPNEKYYC